MSDSGIRTTGGGDADTLDGFEAVELVELLTVALFEANAATGTAFQPELLNDGGSPEWDAINEYCEVDFGKLCAIKQYRQYGAVTLAGDGTFKIQYWDGTAWQDWETGIPTRPTADWSNWVSPAAGVKTTTKIRVVATTLDTLPAPDKNMMYGCELKY